jgi:hypothetical protein
VIRQLSSTFREELERAAIAERGTAAGAAKKPLLINTHAGQGQSWSARAESIASWAEAQQQTVRVVGVESK